MLTQKLLKQGYRYQEHCKTFSKFYRRYYDLISKFQVGLKSLLRQGLSEPDFYGDLVYKLKKIVGSNNFSAQFIKTISTYKKLAITLMYCNRLHAIWSTQSPLVKIVSEYNQEIPQSHTADNPKAPRGRATQPSQDTRETN